MSSAGTCIDDLQNYEKAIKKNKKKHRNITFFFQSKRIIAIGKIVCYKFFSFIFMVIHLASIDILYWTTTGKLSLIYDRPVICRTVNISTNHTTAVCWIYPWLMVWKYGIFLDTYVLVSRQHLKKRYSKHSSNFNWITFNSFIIQ